MAAPQAKGGLSWAILAAALAVPGLLSFNWWSHLKAERQRAISQKARGRVPDGGVFASPPADAKPVNPVTVSTAVPAAGAPGEAGAAAPAALSTAAASSAVAAAPAGTPTSAGPGVPALPAPGGLASAAPGAGGEPSSLTAPGNAPSVNASSAAATLPALPRDPTLSPMDLVRMQQEDMERQLAEEAMRQALIKKNAPRRPVEIKIESYVDLQGIVANPDGENRAIVNDAVLGAGETFDARGQQVRILKITPAGVTFQWKSKKFVKNVSRDE